MAVAGGVTVAYVCRLDSGGRMDARGTSALRSSCCGVDDALARLLEGRPALVAGGDMAAVQRALAGVGEGTGVVV